MLRLKREVSRLRGERDQASAQMTRSKAAIQEAHRKREQVELDFRNTIRKEFAEATSTLNSLSEGSVGLSDRVKQAEVRSPVRGTVKRLLVNTEGGVVLPGHDIVEIVPLDDTLLLEARIAPRDIAFLSPGQAAMVKFTAYDFLVYGGMEAVVESIGADTISRRRWKRVLPGEGSHTGIDARRQAADHSRHGCPGRHHDRSQKRAKLLVSNPYCAPARTP